MIKFFRRIREKLIEEGKLKKYLVYAIGEIFLVVIGILIALQVNNWRENRSKIELEKDLLKEVKLGLEHDLEELIIAINNNKSYINSQNIIVSWIESDLPYNDSLSVHFLKTTFCTNLLSKQGPFETLKQTGMRTISDDILRDQVSNLYDLDYQELYWWQNEYEQAKVHFRNTFDQYFTVSANSSNLGNGFKPRNILVFKKNQAFMFNLQLVRGMFNHYTNVILKNTKEQIEKTIEMIESKL